MHPRLFPFLRTINSSSPMERVFSRAASISPSYSYQTSTFFSHHSSPHVSLPPITFLLPNASILGRKFHSLLSRSGGNGGLKPIGKKVLASAHRGYRKTRRRGVARRREDELELCVSVCIEENLPDDPEILSIAELLKLNVPMAMKLAFYGLNESKHKTRDTSISDLADFLSVELSVLLCNDNFIRKLNKEWRDEDHATDVLSMSQHVPDLNLPILMLGDIVISVETAAGQAEERGHSLLDEIRILVVHGLLHLLGFDHEISEEAEDEMEREEEVLLKSLGWKGKGLIQSAYDANTNGNLLTKNSDGKKKAASDFISPNSAIYSVTWMELC